ncbi:MAG: HAD family hydrolase [Candidatus Thermoplasmatota archaeon]|nr:HAD family hydrolase [Candidatus Thermoplasmatota archaeon]
MLSDKAIFLDYSNTITTVESENASISKWLDFIAEKYQINGDVHATFAKMRLEKLIDREKRFRTFMEINREVFLELYGLTYIFEEDYYRSHERNLRLRPDFINFISTVRKKFQVVMVTDADNLYTERTLNALEIAEYFDTIVTAEMVRAPKPDPRIFNVALKESHNPSKVVFIGDSERRDIEGAKRMKFFTIKMDDGLSQTVADRTVHNFDEVLKTMEDLPFW